MNSLSKFFRCSRKLRFYTVVFCGGSVCALAADKKVPVLEHKDYTLYMGADFQVEKNHTLFPVVDVVGDSFVINENGERELVRADRGNLNLRVSERLKIDADEVGISNLAVERAYTPARDPRRIFLHEATATADMQDISPSAAAADAAAQRMQSLQSRGAGPVGASPGIQQQYLASAQSEFNRQHAIAQNSESMRFSMQNSGGAFAGKLQDELAKQLFDAVELNFDISSPKTLARPYMVVVARYRNPEDRPDQARNWIYAKQLDPIGPHRRHEHFLQGGLMPGFTLVATEFHLYNYGKEIASEVAHKRVALTTEEAYEYSMIEYIAAHKNDKAAPRPALGALPSDFLMHLGQDEVQGTFYAKVGSDGRVRDVYKDEGCTMKVENAYLTNGIKGILFEPAVEKGKPVDGVAKIRPNRLSFVLPTKT